MKRWLTRALLLGVLLVLAAWGGVALLQDEPVTVAVVAVHRGRVEETVTNSRAGTVKARRRAKLSPEIAGRVAALPHRKGSQVQAGDVLLRLDDAEARASRDLARRDVEAAEARQVEACLAADLAAREWRRNEGLFADGIVSAEILDRLASEKERQAAGCAAARAAAARAAAALRVAEAQLQRTVLRAPFAGVVAEVATEVGEWITPAPPAVPVPPVLDLIQPGSLYVSAPLDEVDAARVHMGQPVRITLDPYPGRDFAGTLVRIAPFVLDVEEQNRTFEVEAEMAPADTPGDLLPGTSADVEVILAAADDVLRIPSYALLEGDRVLVLEDGHLADRPVEIGLRNWEYAEVRSGLSPGEPVVISLDRPEVVAGARAVAEEPPRR